MLFNELTFINFNELLLKVMDLGSENEASFITYVILEFSESCNDDVKRWLNSKLTVSKEKNGAELLTRFSQNNKGKVVFLIKSYNP